MEADSLPAEPQGKPENTEVGSLSLLQWVFLTQQPTWGLLVEDVFCLPPHTWGFPGGSDGKESTCNEGDLDLIPGLGRSPGERNGYPLQYSCLENPMDGRAWQATVHGVAQSQTQLSDFTFFLSLSFGEGNGNPLQCSCLENPMDRGA